MRVRLRVDRPSWAVVLASAVLLASALLPGGATGSNAELESEAAALRFRQQYGFAADASTVRLAQNDPGASTEFGVPLLPDELTEMKRRIVIEQSLAPLGNYLMSQPVFGGKYIDQAAGHVLVVAFTEDPESHRAGIDELLPAGTTYRLRQVENTYRDLVSLQETVLADDAWLTSAGIRMFQIGINEETNRVELGLASLTAESRILLEARYGRDRLDLVQRGPATPTHCLSRNHCDLPIRGGVQLYPSGCSTGFFVTKNGARYILTAGHCRGYSQYQHPSGTSVGSMVANSWYSGTSADAGIVGPVPSNQQSRRVYITTGSYYPMLYVQARGSPSEWQNMTVCLSGRQRGEAASCGPLTSIDVGFKACQGTYDPQTGNCYGTWIQLNHQRMADYALSVGDSGGAVFTGNVAVGIQSSMSSTGRGVYSHITYALSAMGASLCTTCP